MRALLFFLLAMAVRPLSAQRALALGDTVQLAYQVRGPVLGRVEIRRLEGLLRQLTPDSVVLGDTAGPRAVARKDVLLVQRLSGRGYDWDKAALPMVAGGVVGLMLGARAASDDELSGGEAALVITAFTVVGATPGFVKGLDSRGHTGFTIGAVVGAAAGLAVGIATLPEPSPPCVPSGPLCIDFANLEGFYVIALSVAGAGAGGVIGGVVSSVKPGKRWEKLPLPPTALGLRRLSGGRVGLAITVRTH
jgi:hypothetical protein